MSQSQIQKVRSFWEAHALCASAIPYPLGTHEYFDYYDRLREANESLQFSYWLREYKPFVGRRVQDGGSGNGYVLGKYAQEGAEVTGIGIAYAEIDLCCRGFQLQGLEGWFVVGSAEELPFESETFDCVCSKGWMLFPKGRRLFSDRLLKYFQRYVGWFLYGKGRKPWVVPNDSSWQLIFEETGVSEYEFF